MSSSQSGDRGVPILCPELGVLEGGIEVVQWLVDPGELVGAGDRVVELLAEGVVVHVVAPAAGLLSPCRVPPRRIVSTGEVLAMVNPDHPGCSG